MQNEIYDEKNAEKNIDQPKLRNEGRKQLMKNLNEIFVLAKALHYDIIDETNSFDFSKL
jgi:translation initiation factor 2 beta subunit (eIF-2beta)/eIF-5